MQRRWLLIPVAVLAGAMLARSAAALPPAERNWDAQIELYGWAPALSLTAEARGVETTVNDGFFDLLEDLGWAVFGRAEGRYERGLLLLDGFGLQLVSDADTSSRTQAFDLPSGAQGALQIGGIDVHTRITLGVLDTKFGVRALSLPLHKLFGTPDDPADRRRFDIDLLAGLRYWDVTVQTDLKVSPASLTVGGNPVMLPGILPDLDRGRLRVPGVFLKGGSKDLKSEVQWVDPLVGLRFRGDVTQHLSLALMGDIGGWGGGGGDSSSQLTWQGTLGGQYNWGDHWGVTASYRVLGVNRGTAIKNTILYGPQFGFVFRF